MLKRPSVGCGRAKCYFGFSILLEFGMSIPFGLCYKARKAKVVFNFFILVYIVAYCNKLYTNSG